MIKHSKGCVCLACCAARLQSPKAPDPKQGSLFEPVKNDSARTSLARNPGGGTDWVKERFDAIPPDRHHPPGVSYGAWNPSEGYPPQSSFAGLPSVEDFEERARERNTGGRERKEEVLTAHDQRRRGTLLWLRGELRQLYGRRMANLDSFEASSHHSDIFVTADDARKLLKDHPERDPGPPYVFLGALFKNRDEWEWTGKLVESVYGQNNGRQQRAWRFIGK